MICLWLEIILDVFLNQSVITNRFTDRLGSFKPNCQLAAVGHDCARITEAQLVTIVPVLQRQRSQLCPATITVVSVPQTRKTMTLWRLYLYICYLTDTWMSVKEITLYRDPTIWTMDTLIPVRHIHTEARPQNTSYFNRPQCVKRNIMRFAH